MAEMSPLRRRMIEDMKVRNLSPATQRCYVHARGGATPRRSRQPHGSLLTRRWRKPDSN